MTRGPEPAWYDAAVSVNHGPDGNSSWSLSKSCLDQSRVHASEYAWAGTSFDAVLDNNSSLDHLYQQVTRLVQDPLAAK